MELFEKIASAAPKEALKLKVAYAALHGSPFQEEVDATLRLLEKQASLADWGKNLGVSVATGALFNLAGEAYNAVRHGVTKGRNFNKMLTENHDLKAMKGDQAKHVRMAFDTLHRFNPEVAADPLVSGAFVRTRLDNFPHQFGDIAQFDKLVGMRSGLTNAKKLPIPGYMDVFNNKRDAQLDAQLKATRLTAKKTRAELDAMPANLELARNKDKRDAELHGLHLGKAKRDEELHGVNLARAAQSMQLERNDEARKGALHGFTSKKLKAETRKIERDGILALQKARREEAADARQAVSDFNSMARGFEHYNDTHGSTKAQRAAKRAFGKMKLASARNGRFIQTPYGIRFSVE